MNPITDKHTTKLRGLLLTYASLLDFRYKCLCVNATPEALLPIEIKTTQGDIALEKVCQIGIMDDEHYLVAPISQDMLIPIAQAFMKRYPQLRQEFVDMELTDNIDPEEREQYEEAKRMVKEQTGEDLPPLRMLQLTTPEINDDMKKQLDISVDTLEKMCKAKFKEELTKCKANAAKDLANFPEKIDIANKELDNTYNECWELVQGYTMQEKEIIAEANKRYHQREEKKQEEKDHNAGMSEQDKKAVFTYNPNSVIE